MESDWSAPDSQRRLMLPALDDSDQSRLLFLSGREATPHPPDCLGSGPPVTTIRCRFWVSPSAGSLALSCRVEPSATTTQHA